MPLTRTQTWINRATVALFALALLPPALLLRIDPAAAAAEKRTAAPAPALPRSAATLAAFPRAFDAFFLDHFGLRRPLIAAHARLSFFALHTAPSPKVLVGRDGFTFLRGIPEEDGDPIADARGSVPLTPYDLERWRWQLEDQHAWLRDQNIRFLFAIIPGKERLYADRLPPGYEPIGPGSIEQFVAHLAPRATFPFLDLSPPMRAAAAHAIVYRRTDTHWNDTGAWAGIFALTDALRAWFPALPRLGPADFAPRLTHYQEGDMGNMLGLPGEVTEWLIDLPPAAPRAVATPLRDHPLADIITTTGDPNLPTAVLFHDSFGHFIKPLLGEYFHTLRFRWNNAGIEKNIVAQHRPDVVIHLMAERRIRMGQRYDMAIQQHGNRDRFDRATRTLHRWTAAETPAALAAAPGTTRTLTPDGWRLEGRGIEATLPAVAETDTLLPVLRIDLIAPARSEILLTWNTRHPERQTGFLTPEVKAPLAPGPNTVYLPLLDPETDSPPTLRLAHPASGTLLQSIEVRGIPR